MLLMMMSLLLWAPGKTIELETVKTFESVPDDADVFLQTPGDAALDGQGRLHIFDHQGRTLMVWNADGSYAGNYGKQGEGPGELAVFGNSGGPQGYVTIIGDTIYVFDGGARRLNLFNMDLTFRKALPFLIEGGRMEFFQPLSDETFVAYNSSYFSDTPFKRVALFSKDKEMKKELARVNDETWHYISSGGSRRVELYAYAPQLHMAVNHTSGKLILADSHKPSFDVYDFKGERLKTVNVELTQREVTKELTDEYNAQPFIKNSKFFTTAFPERRAYYEQVLAVGKQHYLLYLQSPLYNDVEGYLVDEDGKTLGRFTLKLGEGGNLFSSRGRLIACQTDDSGEFTIKELSPGELLSKYPKGQ